MSERTDSALHEAAEAQKALLARLIAERFPRQEIIKEQGSRRVTPVAQ